MWTNFIIVFLTAVIQITLAYFLVRYGAEGLASASLASTILRLIMLVVLFRLIIPNQNYKSNECVGS